ncbi:unnamed protein product [Polarella glacialis]|uniref:C3H1-type domain-containing protein n=1 Tax=Polarella glacialis TaxID=89957 RepID=A0A813HUI7_POLGL|nr:unnamed protein product [Polarella glacialis]
MTTHLPTTRRTSSVPRSARLATATYCPALKSTASKFPCLLLNGRQTLLGGAGPAFKFRSVKVRNTFIDDAFMSGEEDEEDNQMPLVSASCMMGTEEDDADKQLPVVSATTTATATTTTATSMIGGSEVSEAMAGHKPQVHREAPPEDERTGASSANWQPQQHQQQQEQQLQQQQQQPLAPWQPEQSIGAQFHAAGVCRPCAWFWREQGCVNGESCQHCHLCPVDELRRRKNAKKASLLALQAQGSANTTGH